MNTRLVCAVLLASLCAITHAQDQRTEPPFAIEIHHIRNADTATLVNTGYFPDRQPVLYWHDPEWNIDLVIPPANAATDAYSLSIRSAPGTASTLQLPEVYGQIDSITRASGDKAVLIGECGGTCSGFLIVDLKAAKLIDDIGAEDVTISPSGRFILYDRGHPSHAPAGENIYQLYDTSKSPRENVCGWSANDPQHKTMVEDWRGFQVYPQAPRQTRCSIPEDPNDDNMGFKFTWSADSGRIVFADLRSGAMSLVLVTMPTAPADLPKTSVYRLVDAENVCANSTDAAGEPGCGYNQVKSLSWNGDSVIAVLSVRSGRSSREFSLTLPPSKFTPIASPKPLTQARH